MFDLTGRVALITGATRGIGRAIADAMARAGARVVVSSRKAARCDETARAIRAAGGEATGFACNVSDRGRLEALAAHAEETFGGIDVLVCNAAVNPHHGPMAAIDEAAYDKIMDTNVKSTLWLANRVLPGMAARGGGAVVVVASIAALRGTGEIGVYAVSKAAQAQLVRNLAVEWGPRNVRVNAIAPGLVRTDFARALWEDPARRARALAGCPLGRLGEPGDVAGLAVFLASPAAAWITGQTIAVDGGATVAGAG